MWSRKFLAESVERAVRAVCWYLLATVGVVNNVVNHSVPWSAIGYAAATVFGLSLVTSLAGTGVGAANSPALLPESIDPPAPRDGGHGDVVLLIAVAALVLVLLVIAGVIS